MRRRCIVRSSRPPGAEVDRLGAAEATFPVSPCSADLDQAAHHGPNSATRVCDASARGKVAWASLTHHFSPARGPSQAGLFRGAHIDVKRDDALRTIPLFCAR
jgi:hypothetical protein